MLDAVSPHPLDVIARGVTQQAHPLVAVCQHAGEQGLRFVPVGVHQREQLRASVRPFAVLDVVEGALGGFQCERLRGGVIGDFRRRAKARRPRHPPHQLVAERVDGLNPKSPGVFAQTPAVLVIVGARGGDERAHLRIVLIAAVGFVPGERARHPQAHFGGGFFGEGDGEDLLRRIDRRQQREIAPHQQLGFAGAGRRLHDERLKRIERGLALRRIGRRRAAGGGARLVHGASATRQNPCN